VSAGSRRRCRRVADARPKSLYFSSFANPFGGFWHVLEEVAKPTAAFHEECMATCPECDAEVDVDETDVDLGDEVSCPECGSELVVSGTDPLELDFASDDDEDEDDEEEEEEDLDDELEEDGDEDDEEGDWEEE
jgi:alpha-aminoadipate carrier protein LysW